MLRPDKHLNPQLSILNIGALIIKALKETETGMLNFDELLSILIKKTDKKVKEVYLQSLSFLFLMGKIKYHKNSDLFELVK